MRPFVTSFYEITLEPETFLKLTNKLISFCGQSVIWRTEVTGANTVMLRDAQKTRGLEKERVDPLNEKYVETPLFGDLYEQEDRLEYEAENFWGIYRRIADEFIRVFGKVDLHLLPFRTAKHIEGFAVDVWSSFFEREVWDLIEYDQSFAVLVIQAISYPNDYLKTMNELDGIISKKYRIPAG